MTMLSFEGKEIETDNDGYLKESGQWSEALAEVIAEKEGITLSPNTGKSCVLCANFISNLIPLRRSACW